MRGFLILFASTFLCIACSRYSSRIDGGDGGRHGTSATSFQDHHGTGCHMERTDSRSVSFTTTESTAQCTSTHSQCRQEILDFTTGCDTTGCFLAVNRQSSGNFYQVTFDQLQTPNETHFLRDFSWSSMVCETRAISGVSGIFCITTGTKMVEGTACQLQWSTVLPTSGMMTTSRYSCRPDTMKVDMIFSSCIAESLLLRASFTGPRVNMTVRSMEEESFNGVFEKGMLLQDKHTYFSWVPHASNAQMPVTSQIASDGAVAQSRIFTIHSRNATLVNWDPKLGASIASLAKLCLSFVTLTLIISNCF